MKAEGNELSELWKQYKSEQKERRSSRLPIRQNEIEQLSDKYDIKKLTDYQYRINDVLDLYPIHNRWHNIKTNKRGGYKNPLDVIIKQTNI
jgi:hypothetical protein